VDRVLEKLEGVVSSYDGKHWSAFCPVHEGDGQPHSRSLSVGAGDNGGVLIKCHYGCATEDIVAAIGLKMSDLFEPREEGANGQARIVKCYSYFDESGCLVFQSVRYLPKNFKQRRPKVLNPRDDDPSDWEWNLNGVRRVIYRLPGVLAAEAGRVVFVCEGEKD